jgi:putative oxidoreductase
MDTIEAKLSRYQPQMLSILRIMFGLLYLQHGLVKWFGFPAANPNFANIHFFTMLGIAGVIEIVGGALVTVGLFTRYAAFIMSGEMAVAYFYSHAARNFFPLINGGDAAILYCFIFFYIFVAGGGAWSMDRLRSPGAYARHATG